MDVLPFDPFGFVGSMLLIGPLARGEIDPIEYQVRIRTLCDGDG